MDNNLSGDGDDPERGLGACGLYREISRRSGAPTTSSPFAASRNEFGAQQPEMIGSSAARARRQGRPKS